ncbi:MAG: NAD(P)H-hydrate dehydratase [Oligoflexia bacterium]|nr:NAD(P)H-hydrate dehydratase [Oligoflexia bacterium]
MNKDQNLSVLSKKEVMAYLPSYPKTANKTDRGWSLIAAGREGMWGCGLLACRSAYTVGSGYVTWASVNYPYQSSLQIPEALLARLEDKQIFDKKTAVGAGPGLGCSKRVESFILKLKDLSLPALLDADALTLISQKKSFLLNKNFVLTPHTGELSRLLNVDSKIIEKNRLEHAKAGAVKYNCWLLLKGFQPILSNGEQNFLIPTGNSALGKAGTGDALTGIITGLMAQGLSVFKACALGAMLHGETSARWLAQGKDINSFTASEIINQLPFVMSDFRSDET